RRRHRRARARPGGGARRLTPPHLRAGAPLGARHRRHRPGEPDGGAALARPGAPPPARRAGARPPARRTGRHPAPEGPAARPRRHRDDARLRRRRQRGARGAGEMSVAGYPGPAGSHSAAAALLLAPEAAQEPLASVIAVAEAAVAGEVTLGVLPIENSLHGPVAETHDLLYEAPLSIVSEVTLPIVHCLVARTPIQVSEVKTLRSNPVAFDQCREFVHTTGARCIATETTAGAAREVSESDDLTEAAIASAEAAAHFGLHVIGPDVGDHPAFPRFVGIAPYARIAREPRGRTALSMVTDHQPGSLYHALGPFHRHGLNLVQLVSRPIPNSTFRYRFDIVMDGHPQDSDLQQALPEMRDCTREGRILGSYPATGESGWAAGRCSTGSGRHTSSTSARASRRSSSSTSTSSTRSRARRRSSRCAWPAGRSAGPT